MRIVVANVTDDSLVYRNSMRTNGRVADRPGVSAPYMLVYCEVNGLKAKALLDCGSTINCVSPDFADVARLKSFTLSQPLGLQMGCVGSRSRINFGVRAKITLLHCWPLDKATRDIVKDEKHPAMVRHVKRLKNMKNTHFEAYSPDTGKWVFTVEKF